MALFGKTDENLPLLTRWYQVDPPEWTDLDSVLNSEMYEFLNREWLKSQAAAFLKQPGREHLPAQKWEVIPVPIVGGWEIRYPLVHGVVRRLMNALADDTAIGMGDVGELEKLFQEQERRERPGDRHIGSYVVPQFTAPWLRGKNGKYEEAPARSLYLSRSEWLTPPAAVPELTHALEDLLHSKLLQVYRCIECENPFIATRSGQKYCSHRCGARIHIRARRKKDKDDLLNRINSTKGV